MWCVFLLVPSCARRSPPTPIVNNGRNSRQDTTASTVIRICERICPRYVQYMPSSTSTHTHTQTHARVQRSVQRELGGCGRGLRGGRGAGAGGRGAGALRRHRVKATCGWVVTRERTLSLSLCPAGSSKFATIERRNTWSSWNMVLQSNQGLMDCGVQVTVVHHAMVKRLGSGSAERECRKPTARRLATVPLPHVELPAKLLVALLLPSTACRRPR